MNYADQLQNMIDALDTQLDSITDAHIAGGGHALSVRSTPDFKRIAAQKAALKAALELF